VTSHALSSQAVKQKGTTLDAMEVDYAAAIKVDPRRFHSLRPAPLREQIQLPSLGNGGLARTPRMDTTLEVTPRTAIIDFCPKLTDALNEADKPFWRP